MKCMIVLLCAFCFTKLNAEPVMFENQQFRLYTFEKNNGQQSKLIQSIQQAYDAFEFYFDIPGQEITVVVFPTVDMMQTFNLETVETRGKVLPFLLQSEQPKTIKQNDSAKTTQLLASLGVTVKHVENRLIVEETLSQIIMLNGLEDIQVGDQLIALNEITLTDLSMLDERLNELNNGETFSLGIIRENVNKKLTGKKIHLKTQTSVNYNHQNGTNVMLGALQHEIGHFLLIEYMNDASPKSRKIPETGEQTQVYGSLKTPDWLDELVANMCESEHIKNIHKGSIKQVSDLMPLNKLLTTPHPSMNSIINSKAFQEKRKQNNKTTQAIFLTMEDFTDEEREEILSDTSTFYGSSLFFGEYLYHKGGSHLLNSILERVRIEGNVSFSELIKDQKSLHNSMDQVEQDFHRFVALRLKD